MPVSLALIMGFIGAAIAMLILITLFSAVDDSIVCPSINSTAGQQCEQVKSHTWTIVAIMPIALFFVLFTMMGGLSFGEAGGSVTALVKDAKGKLVRKKVPKEQTLLWKILLKLGLATIKEKQ